MEIKYQVFLVWLDYFALVDAALGFFTLGMSQASFQSGQGMVIESGVNIDYNAAMIDFYIEIQSD